MEWPFFRNKLLYLVAISISLLAAPSAYSAEKITGAWVVSYTGSPSIISAGRSPLPIERLKVLRPNTRIKTGPRERVEIQFSENKGCRLILGPNSVLELKGAQKPFAYRAFLRKGLLSCSSVRCRAVLDIETMAGRLRGQNSRFSVRVSEETTTVFLKSGDLRLFLGGESIPLREMTRTTISYSGSHRIASIGDSQTGVPPVAPPMAFQDNDRLSGGISPVSATKGP